MPLDSDDIFKKASDSWEDYMDKSDFHSAIDVGMEAYKSLREINEDRMAAGALNLVYVAIAATLKGERQVNAEETCSFCGRARSSVRLGAGPGVFICVDCATAMSKMLRDD